MHVSHATFVSGLASSHGKPANNPVSGSAFSAGVAAAAQGTGPSPQVPDAPGKSGQSPAHQAWAWIAQDPSLAGQPFGHLVSQIARGLISPPSAPQADTTTGTATDTGTTGGTGTTADTGTTGGTSTTGDSGAATDGSNAPADATQAASTPPTDGTGSGSDGATSSAADTGLAAIPVAPPSGTTDAALQADLTNTLLNGTDTASS